MAFCNNCGAPLPPNAKFCQNCAAPAPPAMGFPPPTAPVPAVPGADRPIVSSATVPVAYARPIPPGTVIPYPPIRVPPDLPFSLQEGEVLYKELIPDRRLFWRLVLNIFGAAVAPIIFVLLLFLVPYAISGTSGPLLVGAVIGGLFGIILVIALVSAAIAYPKFRYWVTNQRTVGRRGIVGYSIDSVPLETVSDLVVSRSVLDRILGISSLHIQPFGGAGGGGRHGGGISGTNSFLGLLPEDVPQIQHMVLHLRDVRRRETGRLF